MVIFYSYVKLPEGILTLWSDHSHIHKNPLVMANSLLLNMAIEIVDLPMKNGDFHSYVKNYQRVDSINEQGIGRNETWIVFFDCE